LARQLPGSLASGQSAADDVNWAHSFGHFRKLGRSPPGDNLAGINQARRRSYEDTDDPAKSGVSHCTSERQGTPEGNPACSM
jgi:hypothetical protein